jgi:predicted RecB family nuclease
MANPLHLAICPDLGTPWPKTDSPGPGHAATIAPSPAPPRPTAFPLSPHDLPSGDVELYFDIEAAPDVDLSFTCTGYWWWIIRTGNGTFHALLAETLADQEQGLGTVSGVGAAIRCPHLPFCPYEAQTARKLTQHYSSSALRGLDSGC